MPCGCGKAIYTGETKRLFETRLNEHKDKVRLTKQDIAEGNHESAEKRMGTEDGGIAKHSVDCQHKHIWNESKIVARESAFTQRKILEGIESLRIRHKGIEVLNNHRQLHMWRPLLYEFFSSEKENGAIWNENTTSISKLHHGDPANNFLAWEQHHHHDIQNGTVAYPVITTEVETGRKSNAPYLHISC